MGLFYKQLTKAVDKGPLEIVTAIILIDVLSTVLSSTTPPCPFERRGIPGKSPEGAHSRGTRNGSAVLGTKAAGSTANVLILSC